MIDRPEPQAGYDHDGDLPLLHQVDEEEVPPDRGEDPTGPLDEQHVVGLRESPVYRIHDRDIDLYMLPFGCRFGGEGGLEDIRPDDGKRIPAARRLLQAARVPAGAVA